MEALDITTEKYLIVAGLPAGGNRQGHRVMGRSGKLLMAGRDKICAAEGS